MSIEKSSTARSVGLIVVALVAGLAAFATLMNTVGRAPAPAAQDPAPAAQPAGQDAEVQRLAREVETLTKRVDELERKLAMIPAASLPTGFSGSQKLRKIISLSFPRNTLERTMQLLSEELDMPITIRGGDLQLEGITKNQSFSLDQRDKPAAEILQVIMKQANPNGKLVYIIMPTRDGKSDEMFITTRAAVAKNGETLPPELQQKPR